MFRSVFALTYDMIAAVDSPGKTLVQEFIARENIKRFEAQLAACSDPEQRATLLRLLEQAHQQLAQTEHEKRSVVRGIS